MAHGCLWESPSESTKAEGKEWFLTANSFLQGNDDDGIGEHFYDDENDDGDDDIGHFDDDGDDDIGRLLPILQSSRSRPRPHCKMSPTCLALEVPDHKIL